MLFSEKQAKAQKKMWPINVKEKRGAGVMGV
jgi:hypothetical protein